MPKASKSKQKYDKKFNATPKHKKERAKRNAARKVMEKAGKVKKHDGLDIDHRKPLRSGGSNAKGNLRVQSQSVNRASNGKRGGRRKK